MKKITLIIGNEFKNLLATKKVLFVIFVYVVIFILGIKIASIIELFSFFVPKIRQGIPFQVLLPFYSGIIIIPILSLLTIYDTVSREFENKSLKYIAYRVPRNTILFGKLIAPFLLITATNFLLYLVSATMMYRDSGINYFSDMALLFVISAVYCIMFLGIGLLVSVIFKNSQKSLWNGLLIMLSIFILDLFRFKLFDYISPFKFAVASVKFASGKGGILMLILFVIYSALLITTCMRIFAKKDLY